MSTKEHDREQQPEKDIDNVDLETKKHENIKDININANNYVINSDKEPGELSNSSIESCHDMLSKNPILTKNELINDHSTVNDREKCEKKNSELNVVPENLNTLNNSDEERNFACKMMLTKNSDDLIKGKEKKIDPDIQSCKKLCKEIAYELKILLAKYSVPERGVIAVEKIISQNDENSFSPKELTCFKQSSRELNSQLVIKSKISDQQSKPSCSFHYHQYSENTVDTPLSKSNYRPKSSTKLNKRAHTSCNDREFHNSYKHTSKMSSKETAKHYSGSKMVNYEKLREKDHKHNFDKLPGKKDEACFKKYSSKKHKSKNEMVRCETVKEAKFGKYNNKLDYQYRRRNVSKSDTPSKGTKLDSKNYSGSHSRLPHISQSSNLFESNKMSSSKIRSSMNKKKLRYKLQKHEKEQHINSDTNNSSPNSAESTSIQLNPKRHSRYANYFNKAQKRMNLIEKKNLSSRKMRLEKRNIKDEYETNTFHRYSSSNNFYRSAQENPISLENEYYKVRDYNKKVEKKRVSSLISRQINEINKCLSRRKNDLTKSVQGFSIASNGCAGKDNINKKKKMEKVRELINRPFKQAENCNAKQKSYNISDSSSVYLLPVEQVRHGNEKKINYFGTQIFDVRHGIEEHDTIKLSHFQSKGIQNCSNMPDESNNKSHEKENEIVENTARVAKYSNNEFCLENNSVMIMKDGDSHDELKSTSKERKNNGNQLEKKKNTKEALFKQTIVVTIDSDSQEEEIVTGDTEYKSRADFLDDKNVLIQDIDKICNDDITQEIKNKGDKKHTSEEILLKQIPVITIYSQEEEFVTAVEEYKSGADFLDDKNVLIQDNQDTDKICNDNIIQENKNKGDKKTYK